MVDIYVIINSSNTQTIYNYNEQDRKPETVKDYDRSDADVRR